MWVKTHWHATLLSRNTSDLETLFKAETGISLIKSMKLDILNCYSITRASHIDSKYSKCSKY